MKRRLVFIGPIMKGKHARGGDTMKNQLFLDRFEQVYDKVIALDTYNWKKKPLLFPKIITTLFFHRGIPIVISANPGSADTLIRFLDKVGLARNVVYCVIGGTFHIRIRQGRFSKNHYKGLKAILVEGRQMVDSLNEDGFNNVFYSPNFKVINQVKESEKKSDDKTHFVFLSRIEKSKGCDIIFESIDSLNNSGYLDRYDVMFYGSLSKDADYAHSFLASIASHQETSYGGLLNLRDQKNYDILAQCDVMLFPTFWQGEGFPGVVIDAYMSSLPIIATDWNMNRDIIEDGKTGWIIPPHDSMALAEKMKFVIDNPQIVREMS